MSHPQTQRFPATGPVKASVRIGSGEVTVVATQDSVATVTVSPYDESEGSRTAAANTSVDFSDGRLRVEVPDGKGWIVKRSGRVRIDLSLPHDSALKVQSGSADIRADGQLGRLDVQSGSGDTTVRTISGDIAVSTGSGDVRCTHVGGELRVTSGSGDISVAVADGLVTAGTGSGDVSVDEARAGVRATTASGDVRIGLVGTGDVKVSTASGDVAVGVASGTGVWLDLNTVSGSTRSNLDMSQTTPPSGGPQLTLRIGTVSGDITINRASVAHASAATATSAASPGGDAPSAPTDEPADD